jgi:hypothetical protein
MVSPTPLDQELLKVESQWSALNPRVSGQNQDYSSEQNSKSLRPCAADILMVEGLGS